MPLCHNSRDLQIEENKVENMHTASSQPLVSLVERLPTSSALSSLSPSVVLDIVSIPSACSPLFTAMFLVLTSSPVHFSRFELASCGRSGHYYSLVPPRGPEEPLPRMSLWVGAGCCGGAHGELEVGLYLGIWNGLMTRTTWYHQCRQSKP